MTRVAIAYDDYGLVAPDTSPGVASEAAILDSVAEVESACAEAGWEAFRVEVGSGRRQDTPWHVRLAQELEAARPDVVVNFIESVDGDSRMEAAAAWMLELSGIPYTGAGPRALALALEKPVAKAMLASQGLPVAKGVVVSSADDPLPSLAWPLIVKPSREDASNGISQKSVVETEGDLRRAINQVIADFRQPALVEEYVDGREINVALLGQGPGVEVLPLAEIDFSGYPDGYRRIVTYDAKWNAQSVEYSGSVSVAADGIDPEVERRIRAIAVAAHQLIGLRDYARVDIRLHPVRGPVVLEVNPNPDCSMGTGLALTAGRAGISHPELLRRIIESALARSRRVA